MLPNKEPQGRASLRLVVGSGSLYETEAQRGLAHFLEHMAFNGSTHYAPGTLVEYFQRLGMSFGGDTNAYTSFDSTVYMLELPNTQAATLAEGFQVFADYAGGLLLENQGGSTRSAASSSRKNAPATPSSTAPSSPSTNSSSAIPCSRNACPSASRRSLSNPRASRS